MKPIMMMVQALRPKITMNSGYIRTIGAEATAATQVSQACRSRLNRCIATPMATPTTVSMMPAARHSPIVSMKRRTMCSSTMTRSKLAMISDGGGTMKRLSRPPRIRSSTSTKNPITDARPTSLGLSA